MTRLTKLFPVAVIESMPHDDIQFYFKLQAVFINIAIGLRMKKAAGRPLLLTGGKPTLIASGNLLKQILNKRMLVSKSAVLPPDRTTI